MMARFASHLGWGKPQIGWCADLNLQEPMEDNAGGCMAKAMASSDW